MVVYGAATGSVPIRDSDMNTTNFQNWLVQTGTPLHPTMVGDWDFHAADWNKDGTLDLVLIKQQGATGMEVHALDGQTGFRQFCLHSPTVMNATDLNWSFMVGDYNKDGTMDVFAIKKLGAQGKTEVHVLNGSDGFQRFVLHTPTRLDHTDKNWAFQVVDVNGDGKEDLLAINMNDQSHTSFSFLNQVTEHMYWIDRSIWSGGSVPTIEDTAIIPQGKAVYADSEIVVDKLEINGDLYIADPTKNQPANTIDIHISEMH